ncbi:hypothetical protein AURDEDRAFT_68349 [Auricularia subglabra TFB-10046 SS5]|nr:hypothetical protein AURDEDRAFT_68349 [Auricularia subglabra TFB-10046 SS5]
MNRPNPLQDDYTLYTESDRGGPEIAALHIKAAARGVFKLTAGERFWRDVQPYLLQKGYRLRPRYTPGWTAPWVGTDIHSRRFEEAIVLRVRPSILHARCEADGMTVAIKWIPKRYANRNEVDILAFLSSPEMQADARNHCYPLLDSFPHPTDPNGVFMVTPWLFDFTLMPLNHVNEVVDDASVVRGAHRDVSRIVPMAHLDCTQFNILQDARPAFPAQQPHPQWITVSTDRRTRLKPLPRSQCEPRIRYYFIDFGISVRCEGPGPHRVTGSMGRDPTAPELSDTVLYDPFKLDVYILGNFFLQSYAQEYSNIDFLRSLLLKMTRADPSRRPTIDDALTALRKLARRVPQASFSWRLRRRSEGILEAIFRDLYFVWNGGWSLLRGTREPLLGRPKE